MSTFYSNWKHETNAAYRMKSHFAKVQTPPSFHPLIDDEFTAFETIEAPSTQGEWLECSNKGIRLEQKLNAIAFAGMQVRCNPGNEVKILQLVCELRATSPIHEDINAGLMAFYLELRRFSMF